MQQFAPDAQSGDLIRLVLPLTVRHQQLLLSFDLEGPDGASCALLLRDDGSEIQARYLIHVIGAAVGYSELLASLWLGICRYTPDEWREHAEGPSRVEAIASYLRADIDLAIEVGDVRRWLGMLEPARVSLIEALGEPEDPESSSECVLLAIPFMPITPSKVEAIDALLDEFVAAVDAMGTDARAVLAEYGRRWEVLVDVALPVDRHTKIQICEQRPWINSPSPTLEHDIVFADARTTHVEIRVADDAVVLRDLKIRDLSGERYGRAVGDAVRETPDAIAIYAADPERPYFAKVSVRVKARLAQRMMIWVPFVMVALAALAVVVLPEDLPNFEDALALLTFPLTVAVTVVLTRPSSPLADRLLLRARLALGSSVAALWAATVARLLYAWY